MSKKLLITRPEHDDTTHYLSNWSKKFLAVANKKEIKVLDLNKDRANRAETQSMLIKQDPNLVILNGHGNDGVVTGHNNKPLIVAGKNEELLKGKITYAISCRSAKRLGPKSVESGAKAYIGYVDDFIFFYDPIMISRPLKDETARLFLEPSCELASSLIKSNTVEESCRRSKEAFKKSIRKLLSSEATREEASMARYLWWDMRNQTCFGDRKSKF